METRFFPDPGQEKDKLVIVEHVLGEGGLIEKHLRWKDRLETPSAGLADDFYGYQPPRFTDQKVLENDQRPSREPVDFTQLATDVLGVPYDIDYPSLVERVIRVDHEWIAFLIRTQLLDENQALAMEKSGAEGFLLDTLTEDNLPAYTSTIFGGFMALAKKYGIELSALLEWSRGIWSAEENGHLLAMNEYGKVKSIINTPEHVAGRTSQLRSGMEIELQHVIQLFAYVAWQEFSAMLAHRRNGTLFGPVGFELQKRIGDDESRHHYVYLNVLKALYDNYPDDTIQTLGQVLINPVMPGSKGVPRYKFESAKLHGSAVFGVEHAYQAARVVLQKLGLLDENKVPEGLSSEAKLALKNLRQEYGPEWPEIRKRHRAFVLGKTITAKELADARHDYSREIGLPV